MLMLGYDVLDDFCSRCGSAIGHPYGYMGLGFVFIALRAAFLERANSVGRGPRTSSDVADILTIAIAVGERDAPEHLRAGG